MAESAASVAQNPAASPAERFDAQADVHKATLGDMIPTAEMQPVIDFIRNQYVDADLRKAQGGNVVPFPKRAKQNQPIRSVMLDEYQVGIQGEWWDRPSILGFDGMRAMVDQMPILSSIVLTRQRQISRFCRPQTNRAHTGFIIEPTDKDLEVGDEQRKSIKLLEKFITNCGWEDDPRVRKRLKRDTFTQFMAKSVRDTLTMDACPIETVFKRDRSLGLDGFVAVDGGSIRLCTEEGYEGEDEIFALQVIQGQVRSTYNYDQLVYEVRNPRTDVTACGYGLGETEMLIRIVTYLLNTMTFNGSFFDKNAIPRGVMTMFGDFAQEDAAAMKRYWNATVSGMANAHNMPLMIAKDKESGAVFTEIGGQMSEMAFSKWTSFLTSVACAVYGIDPEEISLESYATQGKGLGGSDTEEKLASSTDKGLRPLLGFYEAMLSDFVIRPFSPNYCLRFKGLDQEDDQQRFEARKLGQTWNEFRKTEGEEPIDGPIGDMPMNPSFIPAWQAATGIGQPQPEEDPNGGEDQPDFGDPDQADAPTAAPGADPSEDEGQGDPNAPPDPNGPPKDFGTPLAKALDFGLPPIYSFKD